MVRDGDRNIAYFYAKEFQRRKKNILFRFKNKYGIFVEGKKNIRKVVEEYF